MTKSITELIFVPRRDGYRRWLPAGYGATHPFAGGRCRAQSRSRLAVFAIAVRKWWHSGWALFFPTIALVVFGVVAIAAPRAAVQLDSRMRWSFLYPSRSGSGCSRNLVALHLTTNVLDGRRLYVRPTWPRRGSGFELWLGMSTGVDADVGNLCRTSRKGGIYWP